MIARPGGAGHPGCRAAPATAPFRHFCGRMPAMADTGRRNGGADDPLSQEFDENFAAAARFREPSAAERARKQGWLARRKRARLARKYSATRQHTGHRVRTSLMVLVLLGVAGAAGWGLTTGLRGPVPAPATHGATPSAPPPASPAPAPAADPFTGSPAEAYASGAAGIVPPAARRVGRYPAAQVRSAYAMARKMLIAADLNRGMLLGGPPSVFARLLMPTQRHYFQQHLRSKGFFRSGSERSTRTWLNMFAPGSIRLDGPVIKVHGSMTAAAARGPRRLPILRITADYLFVYPVRSPAPPFTRMRVVIRDVVWVDFARWDGPQGPLEPWWTLHGSFQAPIFCRTGDGFIHPDFPAGPPRRVRPSGKPINPYSQASPLPPDLGCRQVTGT